MADTTPDDEYPGADEDPRSRADRANHAIGQASAEAFDALCAGVKARGGRILCGVLIVHAEGVLPDGGVEVFVGEGGPEGPEDVLSLSLQGVKALADRYEIPFAVLDTPAIGGQG
jgi:hypothetical protein